MRLIGSSHLFGRKKKEEQTPTPPSLKKAQLKMEIVNKNIDLDKLASEIARYLGKSDDPFHYNRFTFHEFPEKNLRVFNIDYGFKNPTTKFLIVIEGDSNAFQILDHLPANYELIA